MRAFLHRLLRHRVTVHAAIGGHGDGEQITTCHTCGKTWGP